VNITVVTCIGFVAVVTSISFVSGLYAGGEVSKDMFVTTCRRIGTLDLPKLKLKVVCSVVEDEK
jgi:hypothetical protein